VLVWSRLSFVFLIIIPLQKVHNLNNDHSHYNETAQAGTTLCVCGVWVQSCCMDLCCKGCFIELISETKKCSIKINVLSSTLLRTQLE
jgi:hypothetical protein